jgi:hypothetical protein
VDADTIAFILLLVAGLIGAVVWINLYARGWNFLLALVVGLVLTFSLFFGTLHVTLHLV